jgi:hypothetical protein
MKSVVYQMYLTVANVNIFLNDYFNLFIYFVDERDRVPVVSPTRGKQRVLVES